MCWRKRRPPAASLRRVTSFRFARYQAHASDRKYSSPVHLPADGEVRHRPDHSSGEEGSVGSVSRRNNVPPRTASRSALMPWRAASSAF